MSAPLLHAGEMEMVSLQVGDSPVDRCVACGVQGQMQSLINDALHRWCGYCGALVYIADWPKRREVMLRRSAVGSLTVKMLLRFIK